RFVHTSSVIPGAPEQARWMRAEPRRSLPAPVLERIAHTAFPGCRVLSSEALGDGKRNANFKLQLDPAPVPEVIYAEPRGCDDLPPFTFTRWIEGITFKELKRSGDADAIAQAAQA